MRLLRNNLQSTSKRNAVNP